jgi:hypothetical protein
MIDFQGEKFKQFLANKKISAAEAAKRLYINTTKPAI